MRCNVLLLVILAVVLCMSSSLWAGTYSGGDGSAENPYQISSVEDWFELTESYRDWWQHFILTENLDFEGEIISPVGVDYMLPFTGVFNGRGYAIRNAVVYKPTIYSVGIFGCISGGQVYNLAVENANITGDNYVGVVGWLILGDIENCYVTGLVQGNSESIGGLIGMNEESGFITDCYTSVSVLGSSGVGGLVGINRGTISNCHAINEVIGSGSCVGGLVGNNDSGTILSCYASGNVSSTSSIGLVGGLVGGGGGTITFSHASGEVIGIKDVGGLIGRVNLNPTQISFCYATGTVSGIEDIGGLLGSSAGTVDFCYATGNVKGTENVGGLVGRHNYSIIRSCYTTSNVSGHFYVGGMVGQNEYGTIISSYAMSAVNGDQVIGGLVGYNKRGKIVHCYSTGVPTGTSSIGGGLCGYKDTGAGYEDIGNFWDIETSEISTSEMGAGKTTAEMKTLVTFTDPNAAWDISTVYNVPSTWKMSYNDLCDYPRLAWEDLPSYLVISSVPESISLGTGETIQFSFDISRKEDGNDIAWAVAADSNCPWITHIDPNAGSTSSPEDSNIVTVTLDAEGMEPNSYPVRLLVSDGYMYYEAALQMRLFNRVNLDELSLLVDYWMITDCNESQPCSDADWYIDGKINLRDFAQFAQSWLGDEISLDRPGFREYFESGAFNDLPWEHGGNSSWVISADNKYEGTYAAQSGTIADFQTSTLTLTMNAEDGSQVDSISFARKVSSEPSYDYLRFYIDGVEKAKWSGEQDWAVVTYTFTPSAHTFKWTYTKDGSASAGSDRAWIDAVRIYPKP